MSKFWMKAAVFLVFFEPIVDRSRLIDVLLNRMQ